MELPRAKNPGYHLAEIPKGTLGEISKIQEEVYELQDAQEQECRIMALVELSDLVGAIRAHLKAHYVDITLDDLVAMSDITERAFRNGHR